MTRQNVFQQLVKLKNRMRDLTRFQVVIDLIMIYAFLRTVLSGTTVNLFGTVLTQNSAMVVTFLIAIIDLCFTQIRKNYRNAGRNLIGHLGGQLSEDEILVIRQFERY
ncbi:hypothetical protein [Pediococcus ethanolidurans]|uniref:Uncharacterized protein n=1 Tax=Pediococcus ethanolidurans TaxID=319653 RepID=A0A0R2K693_9LACO|nr:hypothetical protein [Pediococcus ethanolidurans]KRN81991.1 hypothetical protein IV87_GL000601 [Pediococcus ethanolidurans]MBU7555142.1 hypothetical protein [Pediococcus ethanolidurans]MBU7563756.1 hypothetical protein [Pediococcus ethanolidurans]MCT4398745.1 hypothetical protein [Pediococcus ethanolidurans]MCV3315559.1 hypothetical protein [Pediococcus ethanolidurans]